MRLRELVYSVFALSIANSAVAQVTLTKGSNLAVDVASDGRVAMDLGGDLWVVPSSGGDARQLTQNLKSAKRPRWSPGASRIVYQANTSGRQGMWLYNFDDGMSHALGAESNIDLHPAWHPDGERIVYSSDVKGQGFDLWEVDISTAVRWRLSDRVGDEFEAAWSADGRDLAYVHYLNNRWALILRRHGQAEEILISSDKKIAAPSWRPDGSLILFFHDNDEGKAIDMVILSKPRLVRRYASGEQFTGTPVSWLDRKQLYYSANGEIRRKRFDAWTSGKVRFRATIQAQTLAPSRQVRSTLVWSNEPDSELVIHAARFFDGVASGYRHNQDLLISGGRIAAIEDHRQRPGAIVIDMGDLTIIPGLIDADARLPGQLAAGHGPDLLTTGVTTIVATHSKAARLDEIWSGKSVPGPRFLSAKDWGIGETLSPELDVTAAVASSRSSGVSTGAALATQFRTMKLAGLNAEQTLRSLGVNAAAAMLADPYLGRIAIGSAADLVFVDGDPLTQIEDTLNVVAVVRNGRFYSISGLFDRAKSAQTVE